MKKSKYDLILFDLDGTLLNTYEGIISTYTYALKMKGVTLADDFDLHSLIGPPIEPFCQEHFGLSEKDSIDVMQIFIDHYKKGDIYHAEKYEGIDETLAELKSRGYLLGVVTNKKFDTGTRILEFFELSKCFDAIEGLDYERKYTKESLIEKCGKNLGVNNSKILLVGDSQSDAKAAVKTNIDYCEVLYGFGFNKENRYNGRKIGSISKPIDLLTLL